MSLLQLLIISTVQASSASPGSQGFVSWLMSADQIVSAEVLSLGEWPDCRIILRPLKAIKGVSPSGTINIGFCAGIPKVDTEPAPTEYPYLAYRPGGRDVLVGRKGRFLPVQSGLLEQPDLTQQERVRYVRGMLAALDRKASTEVRTARLIALIFEGENDLSEWALRASILKPHWFQSERILLAFEKRAAGLPERRKKVAAAALERLALQPDLNRDLVDRARRVLDTPRQNTAPKR